MTLLDKGASGERDCNWPVLSSSSPLRRPLRGAGAPSKVFNNLPTRNRRRPSTSSSTDRPTRYERVAERHGLASKRRLIEGAVVRATGAQIAALAADVDHLSRDIEVTSFMSVSNAAIGADQVHAGLAGVQRFTGAGIGVALIDSGVWTGHRSLAGKVVYAKDFVR